MNKRGLFLTLIAFFAAASALAENAIERGLRTEIERRVQTLRSAKDEHFLVLFGYEGPGNLPRDSHTFASFVRVSPGGRQEWSTISWLPQDFYKTRSICIFDSFLEASVEEVFGSDCAPVRGHNYRDVSQSIDWGTEPGKKLAIWGPYRINAGLHELGAARARSLEHGVFGYMAYDRKAGDRSKVFNCLHAVSDLTSDRASYGGAFDLGYKIWGIKGTKHVLKHLGEAYGNGFLERVDRDRFRLISGRATL